MRIREGLVHNSTLCCSPFAASKLRQPCLSAPMFHIYSVSKMIKKQDNI